MAKNRSWLTFLSLLTVLGMGSLAQETPLLRIGRPEFSKEQPVELGFINLPNGNLHLEIPVLSITERGGEKFLGSFVYDSHIWRVWDQGTLSGGNIWHSDNGGWRFVASTGGQVQYSEVTGPCPNGPQYGFYSLYNNFVYIAPDGTAKAFSNWTRNDPCPGGTPQSSSTAYANDASGYYISVTNYQQFKVFAPDGTIVTDSVANRGMTDTNGNYTSFPGGVVTDQLGRHPYTYTVDNTNHVSYVDVTASDGSTARTTVTYANYNVNTAFGRLQTTEYSGPLLLPQSIVLPNGSTYLFDYDSGTTSGHYGELTRITLPTGAQVSYTYTTVHDTTDSYDRRVSTRNSNGDSWSYIPQTIGSCQTGTCTRKVTVTDPAGNVSILTMQYGYYFLSAQVYKGAATGSPVRSVTLDYDSTNIRVIRQTTTLDNGLATKFEYTYASPGFQNRNIQEVRDWDYYTGTAPSTPVRKIAMTYLATSAYTSRNIIDRVLSQTISTGAGTVMAQTQLTYDAFALAATSGAAGHDYTNYNTTFNTRGNLTQIKRWIKSSNTWLASEKHYDDLGNVVLTKDPLLHSTTFAYTDSYANASCIQAGVPTLAYPTTVTDAAGHHVNTKYYPCTGLKQSVRNDSDINAGSAGTTYSYDKMYRATNVNYPNGAASTYAFNDTSPPLSFTETQPTLVRTTVLDGLGRISQTQLHDPDCAGGAGLVKVDYAYGYTPAQNLRFQKSSTPYCNTPGSPYGLMMTTNYDVLGRVVSTVQTDGSTVATAYSGTAVGAASTVTDEAGKQRKSQTDAFGRVTAVWEDPGTANYETDYSYDVLDNLVSVVQKGGAASGSWRNRSFTYDSLSRLKCAANPEVGSGLSAPATCPATDSGTYTSGTIGYTYDGNGNLLTRTAPKPNQTGSATVVTTYAYDVLNRLTQKSYNDGSTASVQYGYDGLALSGCAFTISMPTDPNPIGRRTGMCDGSGITYYTHDQMGRVTLQQRRTTPSTSGFGDVYSYNLDGSVATLKHPVTAVVHNFTYNSAGRPVTTTDNASHGFVIAATYAPFGGVTSLSHTTAGNIVFQESYNSRLQPLQIVGKTGTPLANIQSSTCPTTPGNLMHKLYDFNSGVDNGNVKTIVNCRDTNRTQNFIYDSLNRIKQAYTTGTGSTSWGEDFTTDAWGNLTNRALHPGRVNYEMFNAAPADVRNRLPGVGYDAAGNMTSNGSTTYTYDAENRLIATAGYFYSYDGDGNRVLKCITNPCTSGSTGTIYWLDLSGETLVQTSAASVPAWKQEFAFFGGRRVARVQQSDASVHYYFADHLGSTSVVYNKDTATIDEDLDYYPYGGLASTDAVPQVYKFTGKERDSESGLDYFGARHYGSSLGRFMAPDNVFTDQEQNDPQSWNMYAYVRNNPLGYTDPTGNACVQSEDESFHDDNSGGESCADVDKNNQNAQPSAQASATAPEVQTMATNLFPRMDNGAVSPGLLGPGDFILFSGVRFPSYITELFGKALGSLLGRGAESGIQKLGLEGAAEAASAAEAQSLVTQAGSIVGNQGVKASSRAIAEQAAKNWVGSGARNIVDRQTGSVVGQISADGTKIARFTSAGKPQPYINLVNKTTGGNLHVSF
jgi:RHS repeat-associated protein